MAMPKRNIKARTVSASDFKAHCLALVEEVRRSRRSLIVTRHGKPVAQVSPYVPEDELDDNPLKGSILDQDDIVSPIDARWESSR